MMKWGVRIMPKPEVLDSKGRTLLQTLNNSGFKIKNCQVGKYIVLELQNGQEEVSQEQVVQIANEFLHNPLIETFTIEKPTHPEIEQ